MQRGEVSCVEKSGHLTFDWSAGWMKYTWCWWSQWSWSEEDTEEQGADDDVILTCNEHPFKTGFIIYLLP